MQIFIYDDIGPDYAGLVSAKSIREQIKQAGAEPIELRINSYGGDVFEAVAIRTALMEHKAGVSTFVDGVAASCASWVGMVGGPLVMAEMSRLMVHNAMAFGFGYSADLRSLADRLDGASKDIATVLANHSGKSVDEALAWMEAETWFTAEEAVNLGLATEKTSTKATPALTKNGRFRNTPKELLADELPRERQRKATECYMANRLRLTRLGR